MSALGTLQRRLRMMLGRGLARLIDDADGLQVVQVQLLDDEVRELEHYQPYGYAYHAPDGGEAVTVAPNGVRANAMLLAIAHRAARLKGIAKGEVALYTDEGDVIHLKRGRIIEVVAGTKVKVTAPTIEIVGNATVSGSLTVQGAILSNTSIADPNGTLQEARDYYNGHGHPGGVVTPQMT